MKKEYLVTKRAGRWIAGQRVPESGRIELSDFQAAYELALGTIIPLPNKVETELEQAHQRRKNKSL